MVKMKRLYRIFMAFVILAVLANVVTLSAAARNAAGSDRIVMATLSGTVSVQMEEFVLRVIDQAERENAGLIVFSLNTPGGLVSAMERITEAIQNSRVPIVMWVPPGARATSAGAFMMQAAHVAAMASGTRVGAAMPVVASGDDVPGEGMRQKVMNDLMAHMRGMASLRGRNEEASQRMIDEAHSFTAYEAIEENVIDIMADDINSLLYASIGRIVYVDGQYAAINVSSSASIVRVEMNFQEQFIQFLLSPDIAYLLLAGGMLALFYAVVTADGFILGTTGVVMLLLGSIGLRMLPFSWAGVALLGAGVIIVGLEVLTGGTGGLLGLLGTGVMVAGGVFLFRAPDAELLNASIRTIAVMSAVLGICFTFFAMLIARTFRTKVKTGQEGLIGLDVEILEDLNPEGMAKCRGEVWKARTKGEILRKGNTAVVTSADGITLIVKEK